MLEYTLLPTTFHSGMLCLSAVDGLFSSLERSWKHQFIAELHSVPLSLACVIGHRSPYIQRWTWESSTHFRSDRCRDYSIRTCRCPYSRLPPQFFLEQIFFFFVSSNKMFFFFVSSPVRSHSPRKRYNFLSISIVDPIIFSRRNIVLS